MNRIYLLTAINDILFRHLQEERLSRRDGLIVRRDTSGIDIWPGRLFEMEVAVFNKLTA